MLIQNCPCIDKYACKSLKLPEEGETLGPFVTIDFVDSFSGVGTGHSVTVGNKSSTSTDPEHCAVIKSFNFGSADGGKCVVTIHDTQGGNFVAFMKHLLKDWTCLKESSAGIYMKVQFGWTKSNCDSKGAANVSVPYYFICSTVESTFSQGKFIFDITGTDVCSYMFQGGIESQQGGEGEKSIHLLDALNNLLITSKVAPNIKKIKFELIEENDLYYLFDAEDNESRLKGPKGKYIANGINKMEVAKSWVDQSRSINGRPWVPQYNFEVMGGELIFREHRIDPCNLKEWDANCIGTYVVNAGKYSPVIEFNPKVNWNFNGVGPVGLGGNSSDQKLDAMQADGEPEKDGSKHPGEKCMPRSMVEGAGTVQTVNPSETMVDIYGKEASKKVAENQALAKKAITIDAYSGITADLVVVGDPLIVKPHEIYLKNVAIVLINPFHIESTNKECGDWLAKPSCNEVMSNKGWIIKAVNHSITAGMYTTTLSVDLAHPGVQFPNPQPLGEWAGGATLPKCG
jgi:hypothetical protein